MSVTYVSRSRNRKLGQMTWTSKSYSISYQCICMCVCMYVCGICEKKYIFCATAEMTHSVSFPDLLFWSSLAPLRRFTALVPSEHPMLNNIGLYTNQKSVPAAQWWQHTHVRRYICGQRHTWNRSSNHRILDEMRCLAFVMYY